MDNFSSGNKNNGLKKLGKVLSYIIVITVAFVGGGAFYKYVLGDYDKSVTASDNTQVAAEVTPDSAASSVINQAASSKLTPTPIPSPTQTTGPSPALTASPVQTTVTTPTPAVSPKPKITQRQRILEEMHKMINSKVVAEYVWGEVPVTEENVEKLIEEVKSTTFSDRDKLLTMLENWKNNDFENAVNDHNYIWEQLGGTVGKATALRAQSSR